MLSKRKYQTNEIISIRRIEIDNSKAEHKVLDKAFNDLTASLKAEQEQNKILANKIKELETKIKNQDNEK